MTITVKHSKTNAIADWTQAQLDEQIDLGNFAPGTTLADIVLPSDWNNDHTLTGLGTMAEQNANSVAITGGSINGTTIGATTASTGKFSDLTDTGLTSGRVTYATTGGNLTDSANLTFNGTTFTSAQQTNLATSSGNVQVGSTTATEKLDVSGGGMIIRGTTNQTASNGGLYLGTSGSTSTLTAINPAVQWFNMSFAANTFSFLPQNAEQVRFSHTNASVNYHNFTGGATTKAPTYSVAGSDTNISMAFQPKGTGAIDLAAGSSGVNISNGGTVTAITRTSPGANYTSAPTWTASAPTTAGGVTASGTTTIGVATSAVSAGGTGYTVGNTLTFVGGTFASAATATVATVSSGVITAITMTSGGQYSVAPTSPVSVTGGSGTGATFNLTFGINSTLAIGNAGSGYIEQPTVTFSGGGGSGAAAFAVVGAVTTFRSLHTEMQFNTAGGVGFEVQTFGAGATTSRYATFASSSGNPAILECRGAATNISAAFSSKGTSALQFYTNSFSLGSGVEQFRVSHIASAVNYVQVTGAATGAKPSITGQGSDSVVGLLFNTKSTAFHEFQVGSRRAFQIGYVTSTDVNYLQTQSSATNTAPILSAQGTDTNIDLALTPKGTGLVRFGTYVAGALLATGYINIKAADGTTYKVLVST